MSSPGQTKEPLGTGLVHHYAAGLRFDTQVKHTVRTTRGLRYSHVAFPLSFLNEHTDPGGGRMSLIRALSILNQIDARQIDVSAVPHPEDEAAVSDWLRHRWLGIRADVTHSDRPQAIGGAALQAMSTGATAVRC